MRNLFIILIWILLGYFYYSISCTCCPASETPEYSEISKNPVTINSNLEGVEKTNVVFSKSEVKVKKDDIEELLSLLPLPESKGLMLVGYAYADEDDSYQLALLRAKEAQQIMGLKGTQVKLEAEISDDNYSSTKPFLSYKLYELNRAQIEQISGQKGFNGILREGKRVHFYLSKYDKSSGLAVEVKNEIDLTARKLRNNFCKIELISYNEDLAAGTELCFQFKEQLIRSGLNPARIATKTMKRGDRDMDMVELRIIE